MKKIIPLFIFVFTAILSFGQCDELFISEYVHGFGNNRALEVYNPTDAPIDLSQYSFGRFSNGETTYHGVDFPSVMLQPYDVYVAVVEKLDSLGTGFDLPVWNGYQLVEPLLDSLTNEVVLNSNGDTVFVVVYDLSSGSAVTTYGNEYHEFVDLQGKADGFFTPVYNINQAMYWNGNDAVVLVKGSDIAMDGSNLIDVVGVIGEDPGDDVGWLSSTGQRLTYRSTLRRIASIKEGTGIVTSTNQDTFAYAEYWRYGFNNFWGLGEHECECDPNFMVNTNDINQIDFSFYPNPVSNELTVTSEENIERVEVFNLIGERVLTQNFGRDASNKININVENLQTGMYVISLYFDGDQQSTQKFIKQ